MTRAAVRPDTRPPGVLTAGGTVTVLLVAAGMRPAITSVGPVLSKIGTSVHLSHTELGLLSALPLLGFSTMSPLVHRPARRLGVDRMILIALLVLTLAIVTRSVAGAAGLWAGTVVVGASVAVLNVLMPVVVKGRYAAHVALMTGLYSGALSAAAAVASGVALPLANLPGGWRWSLGIWALLTFVAGISWARLLRRQRSTAVDDQALPPDPPAEDRVSLWRSPAAWRITLFMGLQSTSFYVIASWFPTIVVARHVDATLAGWYLFAIQTIGIGAGLLVPKVLRRFGSRVSGVVVSAPMVLAGVGLIVAPGLVPLWVVLMGLSTGPALVLALSMIGLASRDPGHGARLSGMVQSVGYALAAVGPLVAGRLRDLTGSWTATLLMVTLIAVTQGLVSCVRTVDRSADRGPATQSTTR